MQFAFSDLGGGGGGGGGEKKERKKKMVADKYYIYQIITSFDIWLCQDMSGHVRIC